MYRFYPFTLYCFASASKAIAAVTTDTSPKIFPIRRKLPIFTFGLSVGASGTFGWTADRFLDDLGEIEPVPKWQAVA
jgi:hypothetical protein